MRLSSSVLLLLLPYLLLSCDPQIEQGIVPPAARFVTQNFPPNPIDHGIYADPGEDAIVLEWYTDGTKKTTGYEVYRSEDDSVAADGLLKNRLLLKSIESSNQLFEPLDTSYVDTSVVVGTRYFYQVRPFNRSQSNRVTYGAATIVTDTTSYRLFPKLNTLLPNDAITKAELSFTWDDPEHGGAYQIIMQNADNLKTVWSSTTLQVYNTLAEAYNIDGVGVPIDSLKAGNYRWRIKKFGGFGGSSSLFQPFHLQ